MRITTHAFGFLAAAAILYTGMDGHAAVVFSEDFSESDGTSIIGKSPDVGSPWTGTAPFISGSSFYIEGGSSDARATFTSALGAGQVLTLTYETLPMDEGIYFGSGSGFAGVSLFVGAGERIFIGDLIDNTFWGLSGITDSGISADATAVTTVSFSYAYDTGAWAFTTGSGVSQSGIAASQGEAFDRIRIANYGGSSIRVDNLTVDISPVPEPSVALLSGFLMAGLGVYRRRA